MHWTQARGHEVIDTDNAEALGRLDALVIDPREHKVAALVVGDRVVSWADAHGIGPDAVTVHGADVIRDAESPLESAAVAGTTDPISKPVFTDEGFEVGVVQDIVLDAESGVVEQVILEETTLDGDRLLGIGPFAVVVAAPEDVAGHRS